MARRIKPFDDSLQKDRRRSTKNSSTDTSSIDAYRQGIELTMPKHFANGIAKIHDGYNDQSGEHGVPQLVYGQDRPILRDDNSFLDMSKFDPLSRFEPFAFNQPFIASIDPSSGPIVGGTYVSITGSGFFGAMLSVDSVNTPFVFFDDRHIAFTTSAHAGGAVNITTMNPGGSYTAGFTFVGASPIITSLSVVQGDQLGGELVPINGSGFTGTTSVTFAGSAATFLEVGDGLVLARAPAGTAGLADVVITTGTGGASTGGTGLYTYWDPGVLSLTMFNERGNYKLGNPSELTNLCRWTARWPATGRFLDTQSSAAEVPSEDDFSPKFDGANDFIYGNNAGFIDTDVWTDAAGSVIIGWNSPTAAVTTEVPYADPGLITDVGGAVAFATCFSDAGFGVAFFNGAWQNFYLPAPINTENIGVFKWSAGDAHHRVGAGAFTSYPGVGSVSGFIGAGVGLGANYNQTAFYTGHVRFVIAAAYEISDADCDLITTWAQNRHGVSVDGRAEIWYAVSDVFDPSSHDVITLKGRNFTSTNSVYVASSTNTYACTSLVVVDDNTLQITLPTVVAGTYSVIVNNGSGWGSCATDLLEAFTPLSLTSKQIVWRPENAVTAVGPSLVLEVQSIANEGDVIDSSRDLTVTDGTDGSGLPTYQQFSFNGKYSYGNYSIITDEVRNLTTTTYGTDVTFPAAPNALRVYQWVYAGSSSLSSIYWRLGPGGAATLCASMYGSAAALAVNVASTGLNLAIPEDQPVATVCVYSDDATIGATHANTYYSKQHEGTIDITTWAPWQFTRVGGYPGEACRWHLGLTLATDAALADTYALTAEKRKMLKWGNHYYGTAAAS